MFSLPFWIPLESTNAIYKHSNSTLGTSTDTSLFVMNRILCFWNGNDYARRTLLKSQKSIQWDEMNFNEPFSNGLFLPIAWCVCVYLWLGRLLSNISKSLFLILMCLLFNLSSQLFVFIVRFTKPGAFIISILIKQKAPSKFQHYLNHRWSYSFNAITAILLCVWWKLWNTRTCHIKRFKSTDKFNY